MAKEIKMGPDQVLIRAFGEGLRRWEEQTAAEYRAQADEKWNVFRISQIGECQAAITRDWLGESQERDLDSLLRLHDGLMAHQEIREIFKLSGLKLLHEERELRKEYKIILEGSVTVPLILVGHQDNAFIWNKKEVVVDFKKASEFSFDKMSDGDIPDAYWDQLQGYLDVTGCDLGILFLKGVHGKVNALTVDRDEKYFQKEVLPRLAKTALFRKRKEVGHRDFHYGLPPCTYCRHQKTCWGVNVTLEDRELILGPTDPRAKDIKTAHALKAQSDEAQEKADKLKSDARAIALSILRRCGSKRITSKYGGITWTSYTRKSLKLLEEKKQEAIRKGFAVESRVAVEFPLYTKGIAE